MRFTIRQAILIAATAVLSTVGGCRTTGNRTAASGMHSASDSSAYFRERISATALSNRDSCLCYARQMLRRAERRGPVADEIFACCCVGQSAFFLSRYDTASLYLERALRLARREGDVWGMGAACNNLGQIAICARTDYLKGLEYFTESVRVLEGSHYASLYHVAMNNLAITYWHRNNPAGLPYAQKVLEYGRAQQDPMLVFYGTYTCAAMYYLLHDYDRALANIEETVALADSFYDQTGVYTLSAMILHAAGRDREAVEHYRIAESYLDGAEATSEIDYYLGFSRLLIDRGELQRAAEVLRRGIVAATRSGNLVSRHLLYRNLSLVYRRSGAYRKALECYETYHMEADSIFTVERERQLSEMQIKYETEKKEHELIQKRLEVLKERRKVHLAALLAAAIAAVLLVVWVLYRRKHALYLHIVSQYQQAIRREKALAARNEEAPSATAKYATTSLSDEKSRALFDTLERLMREQRVYRQQELTKERLAEIVGCNRTYLSQIINEQTGRNVVSYINAFRIQEVVERLSDAACDTPLKAVALEAGFSSLSTFYKLFKQQVGMTPMIFREKVAELARSRSKGTL